MLLQFLALAEGLDQLVQHHLLVRIEPGGVGGVYGGEARIPQGVGTAVYGDDSLLPVDVAEEVAALHLKIGVAVDDAALHLEHEDGDGLVHDGAAVEHTGRIGAAGRIGVGHPEGQVVVAIELLRHPLQMPQVDAIAVFEHPVVVVGQRGLEHGADADGAARSGAHPDHVVVAPLDIDIVVAHEQVQDDVRAGAAVEQVADDM